MHNYKCDCTITNRSGSHLLHDKSDFKWGEFEDGHDPVADIPPKSSDVKAFIAEGAVGFAGTEGTVTYRFDDDANVVVTIYWNVPTTPGTSNTVTADTSDADVAATVKGLVGTGNMESVTITVVDGR